MGCVTSVLLWAGAITLAPTAVGILLAVFGGVAVVIYRDRKE